MALGIPSLPPSSPCSNAASQPFWDLRICCPDSSTRLHLHLASKKIQCSLSALSLAGEASVDLAVYIELDCTLSYVAGAGPGVALVDSSIPVAEELFAPFSQDLFSPELDIQALKGMLTQPLTTRVPVASSVYAQYCSAMPSLYYSSNTESARGLITRFDSALA